ncbi:MAG: hypothetical protein EOP85_00335 [Verrucomicrobiaceae bacterium]|nr:MAG: hypothetical protein EOP85_00335 [Verrucomicrobiaceae bacterium]
MGAEDYQILTASAMQNILVFKTNIQSEGDLHIVKQIMCAIGIEDWNVDRKDIDCVLRVVSNEFSETQMIAHVTAAGFVCEELE